MPIDPPGRKKFATVLPAPVRDPPPPASGSGSHSRPSGLPPKRQKRAGAGRFACDACRSRKSAVRVFVIFCSVALVPRFWGVPLRCAQFYSKRAKKKTKEENSMGFWCAAMAGGRMIIFEQRQIVRRRHRQLFNQGRGGYGIIKTEQSSDSTPWALGRAVRTKNTTHTGPSVPQYLGRDPGME